MTKGSFTVDVIAQAFEVSRGKVRNVVAELYPGTTAQGRRTFLTGAQAARVISQMAGDTQLASPEYRMLERLMPKLLSIENILKKQPVSQPDDPLPPIADNDKHFPGYVPSDIHLEDDQYCSAKEACIFLDIHPERRLLGIHASRTARIHRVNKQTREVGEGHVVTMWPLKIWKAAWERYRTEARGGIR